MGRKGAVAIVLATVFAVVGVGLVATASPSQEESFVSRINAERTSRGIRAVSVSSDLVAVARNWSAQMASNGSISHDPNIGNKVSGWTQLGDNVGRGSTVDVIHTAFMNSDTHRGIILDPAFNQVGVGVFAAADNTLYVTEIFVRRATGSVTTRTTTHHRRASSTARVSRQAHMVDSVAELTGVMWEVNLGPRPVTVSVLQELDSFDAA